MRRQSTHQKIKISKHPNKYELGGFIPDPDSRWWIRYSIPPSLCTPVIPARWRSGILKTGFILGNVFYLSWAVVSLSILKIRVFRQAGSYRTIFHFVY
jgi:hypothetical protein